MHFVPGKGPNVSVCRTWRLWAHRYESGELWHVGDRGWVELHQLQDPIVPILVEEVLGDPYAPEVTHYGEGHMVALRITALIELQGTP